MLRPEEPNTPGVPLPPRGTGDTPPGKRALQAEELEEALGGGLEGGERGLNGLGFTWLACKASQANPSHFTPFSPSKPLLKGLPSFSVCWGPFYLVLGI